jgi:predicted ATPase
MKRLKMNLKLNNIGIIRHANIKLDGLTIIAGENDSGKSTVGKALFALITEHYNLFGDNKKDGYTDIYNKLFKDDFDKGYQNISINLDTEENIAFDSYHLTSKKLESIKDIIFIESPLIWNFTDFFRDIAQIESQIGINLDYPYLMKDLSFKLNIKSAISGIDIIDNIISLIGGKFKKDNMGRYYFNKNNKKIELINTATGIKYFGILQVLSQNNYLNQKTILVLDEPEVHLHPKWQLKLAEVIVYLAKNGVKILVNSHSPYMIEALQRYSEKENIENKTNFYLADDGIIDKLEDSNSKTLSKIFEKLSEPYDEFDRQDSIKLQNG